MKKICFKLYDYDDFHNFLDGLMPKDRRKLLATIKLVESKGIPTAMMMKWVKKITGYHNLYEIRSRFAKNYQRCLYFHKVSNEYVITNYFSKKSNKTPLRIINEAIKRKNKYLRRSD